MTLYGERYRSFIIMGKIDPVSFFKYCKYWGRSL